MKVTLMASEENGFLEYLQLQEGNDLLTKSELITKVRQRGFRISDRQLTFYVSEEILPKSVRVGSRAGVYPVIVAELLTWVLWARDGGTPIEAIRELLPVWKVLIRARKARLLELGELEYVARQHVNSGEAMLAVPQLVGYVMRAVCPDCQSEVSLTYKDGTTKLMNDPGATIGFAMVRTFDEAAAGEMEDPGPQWFTSTRISLAASSNFGTDPTTVILGVKPNEELPSDPQRSAHHEEAEPRTSNRETV